MAMTYLEILGWARKGVIAEKENYRQMQEKALEGQAHDIACHCQKCIDELEADLRPSTRSRSCTTESEVHHGEQVLDGRLSQS